MQGTTIRSPSDTRRLSVGTWGHAASIASGVVAVAGVMMGVLSRGDAAYLTWDLIACAIALPVASVHLYVGWVTPRYWHDRILMAASTFPLALLGLAVGRGHF